MAVFAGAGGGLRGPLSLRICDCVACNTFSPLFLGSFEKSVGKARGSAHWIYRIVVKAEPFIRELEQDGGKPEVRPRSASTPVPALGSRPRVALSSAQVRARISGSENWVKKGLIRKDLK